MDRGVLFMKSDRYAYQQARKSGIGVQICVGTNRFALLKGEAHRIYSPLRLSTPASSQGTRHFVDLDHFKRFFRTFFNQSLQ